MQKRQQRFSVLHTLLQLWNEQVSLSRSYCYVRAAKGFAAPDGDRDGIMSNDYKIRPWFER